VGLSPDGLRSGAVASLTVDGQAVSVETEIPATPPGRVPLPSTEAWVTWAHQGIIYGMEAQAFNDSDPVALLRSVMPSIQYATP
jgi:hypothetical protein